jgi:DNA invertase Pin-like site-specific DNA recombinase
MVASLSKMRRIISYIRVSTQRQGRSGLGLEAQRAANAQFATREGFAIAAEYTEVETGKGVDALDRRPRLAAALIPARAPAGYRPRVAWPGRHSEGDLI